MFAYLKGELTYRGVDYIVVDVGGVGYKIYSITSSMQKYAENDSVKLYTYLNVRENEMTIYGFSRQDELQLFELLITVSGIGPKVALNILNHIKPHDFIMAVLYDDEKSLTKLPGIGKKTAKRIILDLKEKLSQYQDDLKDEANDNYTVLNNNTNSVIDEVIAALQSLGYDTVLASETARKVIKMKPEATIEELLKLSLRNLASF